MAQKVCNECKKKLPTAEFWKSERGFLGVRGKCKKCCQKLQKEVYRAPLERRHRARETRRHWGERNREHERERERKRWRGMSALERSECRRKRDPFKERARRITREAVKKGLLIRPKTCPRCNWKGLIHAHHDDYNKPLEVSWLCAVCHGLRHRELFDAQQKLEASASGKGEMNG